MKRLEVDDLALRDFDAAFDWYLDERDELVELLQAEIRSAFDKIVERPSSFAKISKRARQCRLARFKYAIVFQELPDVIRVIAFANSSRRPMYWRDRQH